MWDSKNKHEVFFFWSAFLYAKSNKTKIKIRQKK